MSFVEIYKLQDDGTQRVIATCRLADKEGVVRCEGEEPFTGNLLKEGIIDQSDPAHREIFPKDGLKFLEQLSYNFSSGYLNASEVKEG